MFMTRSLSLLSTILPKVTVIFVTTALDGIVPAGMVKLVFTSPGVVHHKNDEASGMVTLIAPEETDLVCGPGLTVELAVNACILPWQIVADTGSTDTVGFGLIVKVLVAATAAQLPLPFAVKVNVTLPFVMSLGLGV